MLARASWLAVSTGAQLSSLVFSSCTSASVVWSTVSCVLSAVTHAVADSTSAAHLEDSSSKSL